MVSARVPLPVSVPQKLLGTRSSLLRRLQGPVSLAARNGFLLASRCGVMPAAIAHQRCNFCEPLPSVIPDENLRSAWGQSKHLQPPRTNHLGSTLPVSGCLVGKWRGHAERCFVSPAQASKEPTHTEGRNVHLSSCSAVDVTESQTEVQV